jgi:hypothetical protein
MTLAADHLPMCESILSRLIVQSSSEVGTVDERAIRDERLALLLQVIRDMTTHFAGAGVGHTLEWIDSLRKWQSSFLREYDACHAIAPLLPPVIVQSSRSAYVSVSAWTKLRELMSGWHREVKAYIEQRSPLNSTSSSSSSQEK